MRRYTVLLMTSFFLIICAVAGGVYISGHAVKSDNGTSLSTIRVYTTLPVESVARLADEYESLSRVRVNFIPVTAEEIEERAGIPGKADMVLADSRVLNRLAGLGWLVPYFGETSDAVSSVLKNEEGFWTAVWYDPIVFCYNRDYAANNPKLPMTWHELAADEGSRVAMTDVLAADAASNLLFSLVSQYGEENGFNIFSELHPRVVQYSKFLSTPVRMTGMGEVDMSIAVQSEVLRYINDGYPLRIVYPQDGTAFSMVGTGILLGAAEDEQAKAFADWLQGDEAQLVLQTNGMYFIPANRNTMAYKKYTGKGIVLFDAPADLSAERRRGLLDFWVKNIRIR